MSVSLKRRPDTVTDIPAIAVKKIRQRMSPGIVGGGNKASEALCIGETDHAKRLIHVPGTVIDPREDVAVKINKSFKINIRNNHSHYK